MTAYRADALHGSWVHSHEEDTDGEMVFRPATQPFPPSRGRMAFDLRPDGTYVERSPGATDVPEESSGSWSLEDDRLILGGPSGGSGHAWEVTALEKDELRVRS